MQLIKDYTVKNVRGAVKFYLNTNTKWSHHTLIEHLLNIILVQRNI